MQTAYRTSRQLKILLPQQYSRLARHLLDTLTARWGGDKGGGVRGGFSATSLNSHLAEMQKLCGSK